MIVHPREPLAYSDALDYVERWLDENCIDEKARSEGWRAKVYDYFDREPDEEPNTLAKRRFCGIRISEVDFTNGRAGSSYMQTEAPWGIAVCGQVERCVLALIEGWNDDANTFVADDGEEYGEADNEFLRLEELFKFASVPPGTASADQYEAIIQMFARARRDDPELADDAGLAYGVLSILGIDVPERKED